MNPVLAQRTLSLDPSSILEWLAGVFMAAPSVAAISSYRKDIGAALFEALGEFPECTVGVSQMQTVLESGDDAEAVARRLDIAFTRLFAGAGGAHAVSPYESAYGHNTSRLYQKPAGDIALSLRLSHLSINTAFREPPDHLSIELALLAKLIRHGNDPGVAVALLDDHLLVWLPSFAVRCCDADNTGFYAGAAGALVGFLVAQRSAIWIPHTIKSITGALPCPSH